MLRADHVAGLLFVALGLLVFALSGDLPAGSLAMPGSGFLPMLVAGLTILLGLALVVRSRAGGSFASIDWSDARHTVSVLIITAIGVASYTWLGFLGTMVGLMTALLVVVERRHPARAAAYSIVVALLAYGIFAYLLKAPLPQGAVQIF